jgi:hypothetical protein
MQTTELTPDITDRRTRPWTDDEYVVVDGWNLVYTVDRKTGNLLVHMPGGTTESVERLRNQGHSVAMPRLLRTNDFA